MATLAIPRTYNYWVKPPINMSNEEFQDVIYTPIGPLVQENPIVYHIKGSERYLNTSRFYWYVRGKIRKTGTNGKGTDLEAADDNKIAFCNNIFHTLTKQVKFLINGTDIISSGNYYSFKAYNETCLQANIPEAENSLKLQGFYKDVAANETDITATNTGFTSRAALTNRSKTVEFFSKLNIDFLKQTNHIPPNQSIEIHLYPNTPQFMLQTAEGNVASKPFFQITEARLVIREEIVSPPTYLAHVENWTKAPMMFNYETSSTKILHVPANVLSYNFDTVFNGKIPKKLYLTFCKSGDFVGKYTSNPYFSKPPVSLKNISIFRNGVIVGRQRNYNMSLDEDDSKIIETYCKTIEMALGDLDSVHALMFDSVEFRDNGYFIYSCDFEPASNNNNNLSLEQTGNVSIYLEFDATSAINYECIVTGIFDVETQIAIGGDTIHTFTG